uniref:Uncharacterized protein n=1 Tax=Anguilla anguilla TaxID=7936 RepID=A0A0E9VDR6_ANGAN
MCCLCVCQLISLSHHLN